MDKSKVLFIGPIPPPYMGPTLATQILLDSALSKEFTLIHLNTSDHRDLDKLGAVDFWNLYLPVVSYVKMIYLILVKWPDLVYVPISQTTLGYLKDSIYIIIAKCFRKKVVCHLRGGNFKNWLSNASSLTQSYVRFIHSRIQAQIVLGKSLRFLFEGIIDASRIHVVPNGRDFSYDSKPPSSGHGRVLFLGNFKRTKGVLDVLYAIPTVFDKYSDVEFVFCGYWSEEDLRNEVEEFLERNPQLPITCRGPVMGHEKFQILNSSEIFVFPTYYPAEGHPWVIVEAIAAGLPIITTDHAAISESVINGVNGFLVEKQSPASIAEKILVLLQNPNLREAMGVESKRLYAEKFTEAIMVKKLGDVFRSTEGGAKIP